MKIDLQTWQIVATAIAASFTTLAAIVTFFWRQKQKRSWLINEQFQTDSHTLKLCEALSNPSPQLRLAAAALLLERLKQFSATLASERNQSAIIQALIAATVGIHKQNDDTSTVLSKYIADEVVKALKATASNQKISPLSRYYWQRVQLSGAFWKGVDARGVDFFAANFDKASLRRANLQDAIFYEASLVGTTLAGANIRNVDLRNANLCDANLSDDDRKDEGLRKTEWSGVQLGGAQYNSNTRFPPGLDPLAMGMVKVRSNGGEAPSSPRLIPTS